METKTVVFKDWLREHGVLTKWLRNRLSCPNWGVCGVCPELGRNTGWVNCAFEVNRTPEGRLLWDSVTEEWHDAVLDVDTDDVEAGMPLEDAVGLAAALAGELAREERCGKA